MYPTTVHENAVRSHLFSIGVDGVGVGSESTILCTLQATQYAPVHVDLLH